MNAPLNHPMPLLELDVLRTFVAIAETGSFTTAANAVYRTPSAVSMQIKKLEDILGRSVFSRDARSVSLTTDGEMLLGYARRMLAINREAVSKFIVPDIVGVVRLGEFVEVRSEVVRATRSVVFLEAKMLVGDRVVATASGIWKIIGEP